MKPLIVVLAALIATPVQAQDWDGWFAGFDAGYIWRSADTPGWRRVDYSGPTIDISAGHWWQFDPITLGFDVGLGIGGPTSDETYGFDFGFYAYSLRVLSVETASVSLRAKIGIPFKDSLFYIAGGPKFTQILTDETFTDSFGSGTSSYETTKSGASLSAGIEHRLSDTLSVKGEFGVDTFWSTNNVTNSGWSAKAGLNYHF